MTPEAFAKTARQMRSLFGLDHWQITVKNPERLTGRDEATEDQPQGQADVKPQYRSATIEVRAGLDDSETRLTIAHEFLEVALSPIYAFFELVQQDLTVSEWARLNRVLTDTIDGIVEERILAFQRAGVLDTLPEAMAPPLEAPQSHTVEPSKFTSGHIEEPG